MFLIVTWPFYNYKEGRQEYNWRTMYDKEHIETYSIKLHIKTKYENFKNYFIVCDLEKE